MCENQHCQELHCNSTKVMYRFNAVGMERISISHDMGYRYNEELWCLNTHPGNPARSTPRQGIMRASCAENQGRDSERAKDSSRDAPGETMELQVCTTTPSLMPWAQAPGGRRGYHHMA